MVALHKQLMEAAPLMRGGESDPYLFSVRDLKAWAMFIMSTAVPSATTGRSHRRGIIYQDRLTRESDRKMFFGRRRP